MQKVTLREFNKNNGKETTTDYIVASTKTKNILVRAKEEVGLYVAVLNTEEFYLDRDTAKELGKTASAKLGTDITDAVVKALELACIVKREEE